MIIYLVHNEINKRKWDECLDHSPNGLIFACSWYLDIVCPGWDALVEDDYTSIMPLPRAEKYGFAYTYPPFFTQQLGVFSQNEITGEKMTEFISAIPQHFRYIEMNLNEKNTVIPESFETKKLVTYILELSPAYSEISLRYSTQTRRNLKKALDSSLTIVHETRPGKVIRLFRENKGKNYNSPAAYYTKLEELIQALLSKELAASIGVNDKDNELCAGAFFVRSNDRHIFLFSGANNNAYDSHAMTLLINTYIEEHSGKHGIFDFEGSMDANLARFYSGFGSQKVDFIQIRRNNLPQPARWIKEFSFKKKTF